MMSTPRAPLRLARMPIVRWGQWHLARTIYAADAIVFDYKVRAVSRLWLKLWPEEYSRECPGWAITVADRVNRYLGR